MSGECFVIEEASPEVTLQGVGLRDGSRSAFEMKQSPLDSFAA
jgi:hypothetical protein